MYSEITKALLEIDRLDKSITAINEQVANLQTIKSKIHHSLLHIDTELDKVVKKAKKICSCEDCIESNCQEQIKCNCECPKKGDLK